MSANSSASPGGLQMSWRRSIAAFAVVFFTALTWVTSAQQNQQPADKTPARVQIDVDLVLATATVTTPDGRYVTGLEKEDFEISEDKVEQEIAYFSSEDVPLSVGIIFDVSGS